MKLNAYYYNAVLWAVENGITAGTSETTFSPDKICTRAQIVTFLWRYEDSPVPRRTAIRLQTSTLAPTTPKRSCGHRRLALPQV